MLRQPKHRGEGDEQRLAELQFQCPALEKAMPQAACPLGLALAQDFARMVRSRQAEQFNSWLERATQSHVPAFIRFAKGLDEDYDAVKAGMTLPWSNGQVEGQINRLKMLKRQMYGRASMALLSRRFLLAR